MLCYEMFGRLSFVLLLYLVEHTINSYDDDQIYNQLNGCVCGGDLSSGMLSSAEVRERRQANASDIIDQINSLLGNNSTFSNLTAQVLANLTTSNLTQILDEIATSTNQSANTTQPLILTTPLNTTTSTAPTTIPSTQTSTR